jgi:hypothetical protein
MSGGSTISKATTISRAIIGRSVIMTERTTHSGRSHVRNYQTDQADGGGSSSHNNTAISGSSRVGDQAGSSTRRQPRPAGRGGGGGGRGRRHIPKQNANSNDQNDRHNRPKQQNRQREEDPTKAPFLIESTDFQTNFHARLCRAVKYKVHSPNCACPKVAKIRQRHENHMLAKKEDEKETAANSNNSNATGNNSNEIQSDIDGTFTDQLNRLKIAPTSNPFDNLIVIPDTKETPAIYTCKGTDGQTFQRDKTACERKIAREIFGHAEGGGAGTSQEKVAESDNIPPFKVNCANCLLTSHQRNGFVAIVSDSLEELNDTIQRARKSTSAKVQNSELHADHAHFTCAIELSTLQSLLSAGKTRMKDHHINMEILTQMKNGGVEFPKETMDIFSSKESSPSMQIKMGHHLTSLLWLLHRQPSKPGSTDHLHHVMVIGYQDSPREFELDLPGGKRHLGESTLEGAIREVEEECSLEINEGWMANRVPMQYGGMMTMTNGMSDEGVVQVLVPRKIRGVESGDAFFVMTPPQ